MREHLTSLQEQVDSLYANLSSVSDRQDGLSSIEPTYPTDGRRSMSASMTRTLPSIVSPGRPQKAFPRFHGPTSSAYGFDVAKSTLQTMGIAQEPTTDEGANVDSRVPTPVPLATTAPHPSKDPIWLIDQVEAIRLCRVYEEEMGIMYPLFDIERIINHIKLLYTFIESALRTGFTHLHLPGASAIEDDDTNLVKMVLAITLTLESNGQSDVANRIYETMLPTITAKILGPIDMKGLLLLVLTVSRQQAFSDRDCMRH